MVGGAGTGWKEPGLCLEYQGQCHRDAAVATLVPLHRVPRLPFLHHGETYLCEAGNPTGAVR